MTELVQIDFYGDALTATRRAGDVFVAIRPICDAIGVDWSAQCQRIKRDEVLGPTVVMITTVAADGRARDVLCLPLRLLNGWLFGIDDRRIKRPAVREKVIAYKRECYDVLFQHFMPGPAVAAAPTKGVENSDAWAQPVAVMNAHARVIAEVRSVYGVAAARQLWPQSGLPQVEEADEPEALMDPEGCLAHLLRYAVVKRSCIADLIDDALRGGGDDLLAELGVRVNPPGQPNMVAIVESGAALALIYARTAWRDGGWRWGLLGLTGARMTQGVDFNGRKRRAVLIPMACANETRRFERSAA